MDYDPLTRDLWVCGICRRPLDLYQAHDHEGTVVEYHWMHPGGEQHDHGPDPVRAADSGGEIVGHCDFCGESGVEWIYDCEDFQATEHHGSVGAWGACRTCHRLISQSRWEQLGDRAMRQQLSAPLEVHPWIREQIRLVHQGFREHRQGEARPV